jgi:hypothetical protein
MTKTEIPKTKKATARRKANWEQINQVATKFREATPQEQASIVNRAKELKLVDDKVITENFLKALGPLSLGSSAIKTKLRELAEF